MAHRKTARPTLVAVRIRARKYDIEIAAEREASILAGAQHLYDAARRAEQIATEEEALPESSCR